MYDNPKNGNKTWKPWLFLSSAGKEADIAMGSGVAAFGFALWATLTGRSLPAAGLVLLAGLLFGYGAYRAWAREHNRLDDEKRRNGEPEIKIRLLKSYKHVFQPELK